MSNILNRKIEQTLFAIDLESILSNAKKDKHKLFLIHGIVDNYVQWSNVIHKLSYNYDTSLKIIQKYIYEHQDKIIKIEISSGDIPRQYKKNLVIYLPYEFNINLIKKNYLAMCK